MYDYTKVSSCFNGARHVPRSTPQPSKLPAPHHLPSLLTPTIKPGASTWKTRASRRTRSKPSSPTCNLLASYLPPDRTLGDISTNDLNNFLDWLQNGRGVPCSPKSLARRITSIKAFFRWLHQYGVLLIDPAEKVAQRSVISPLPVVLTEDETQLVLDAADAIARRASPTPARMPWSRCC